MDNQTATILIVDADKASREPLAQSLSAKGYEVLVAQDGLLALQILGGRAIDLVLLEAKMPGLHGFDILKALRKNAATEALPVIMLSGSTDSEETYKPLRTAPTTISTSPLRSRSSSRGCRPSSGWV